MEQLKFFKGKEEDLLKKTNIEAGAIYYCTDTKNTYLGTNQNGLIPYSSAVGKATNKIGGEIFNDYVNNIAGEKAHAEGDENSATGYASHVEGKNNLASGEYQHVQGKYNVEDTQNKYAHIVGGGAEGARKNIHTLDWNGNAWFAGNLKIGGTSPDDPNAKEVFGNDSIISMDDMFSGYDHFYANIAQGRVNPEKSLEISTYDGSGQLTHPCVRYFPEGFGGHQFWMTATPYPYSALDLENPCVWYSDDGYEWSADGIPNPLDPPLMVNGEQASMNSDPHLLLRSDGVMEVWWRTNFWENSNEGLDTVVYRRTSTDGIHWTEKEELFRAETNSDEGIVCPVALYEDGMYKIWAVSNQEYLHYFESVTGTNWVHVRDIDVSNLDHPEYKVWHFDVNHTIKGYEFVGNYNIPGDYGAHKYIYYAVSEDNITYSKRTLILTTGESGSFDERLLYRPTLIRLENQVRIYYGANNANNAWSIGMIEAPSAYLFNALLNQGKRIQTVEQDINELKNKTPIADGLAIVKSFRNSPWLPGYWDPNKDGAFTVYGDLHHTQLVPLANLTSGGQLAEITVTSSVVYWPLVRVNYFNGNLEWIGCDTGVYIDPANGTQEPTPINWPAGAVYVAISANTTNRGAISINGVPENGAEEGVAVVRSFNESPWLPGYWDPIDGALTIYGNMHRTQLVELASLTVNGELPEIIATSSITAWPLVRFNYFDGNLRWIGYDVGATTNAQAGTQGPTALRWPAGAVYVAISANAIDKDMITVAGMPKSGSGHSPLYIATNYGISPDAEDNTAAMQALINKVFAEGGGVIWLPVGTYRFNAASSTALTDNVQTCLVAKSNVSIIGENLTKTIIQVHGATDYGAAWISSLNTSVTSGCTFEKFTVDMSEETMSTYTHKGKAFYMSGIKDCIFRDLRLINTPSTSLGIDMLDNVVIDAIYVYRGGREWSTGDPGGAGIGIGTGMQTNENFVIRNCTCIECGHFGIFLEDQGLFGSMPEYNYPKGQIIANNIVRNGRNYGIGVRGGQNVVITGNNLYGNFGGFYLDYGAKNVLISGNLVADSSDAAVLFGTEDIRPGFDVLACENIVISGNTFIGNQADVLKEREPVNSHIVNNVTIPGSIVAPTRIRLGSDDMILGVKIMPDGSESPSDNAVSTDYLDVSGMDTNIRITTMGITDSVRIAQYGADKNALESDTAMRGVPTYQTEKTTKLDVEKVEGCAYIRMFYTSYNSVDAAVIRSIVIESA